MASALQEPDLVSTVGVSGVGVASYDERIVNTRIGSVQHLGHGTDLVDDGHLIGGSTKSSGKREGRGVTNRERDIQFPRQCSRPLI